MFAALGIFVGGGVLGIDQAVSSALHPSAVQSYPIAYLMLVTTVTLDAFALEVALRPVRKQVAERGVSLRHTCAGTPIPRRPRMWSVEAAP